MLKLITTLAKLLAFVIIDGISYGIFLGPTLFLTRCFFYSTAIAGGSFRVLCAAGLFSLIPSFIMTDRLGADLLVMVPLAMILRYLSKIADISYPFRVLSVFICLLIQWTCFDYVWLGVFPSFKSLILHFVIVLFMVY